MKRIIITLTVMIICAVTTIAQQYPDNDLGSLVSFVQQGQEFMLRTTNGLVKVTVYTPGVIRIRISKQEFGPDFSYSVVGKIQPCSVKVDSSGQWIFIATDSLILRLTRNPVRFGFLTKDQRVINEDDPELGTTWVGEEVTNGAAH